MANEDAEQIKGNSLFLTRGSAVAGGVVAVITGIEPIFDKIFGEDDVDPALRAGIVVAVILAWALIAAVDIASRAYMSGQGLGRVTTAPDSTVTYTEGIDIPGCFVAAVRTENGATELLIGKGGELAPLWVPVKDVRF